MQPTNPTNLPPLPGFGGDAANPPPLPNLTQVGPRSTVPFSWTDTAEIMSQILEVLATCGPEAANRLKDFCQAELAKIRAGV
jgi:hypothetical protein